MAAALRHFIFSDSAAGSLKQALKLAGRRERVFCWADDLSFGPINPPDPATRLEWIERELMIDLGDHTREIKRLDDFWRAAESSRRRLVWFSRRDAGEHADFLEWVWRMDDTDYQVVEFDEADAAFTRSDRPTTQATVNSLAELRPELLAAAHYWDSGKPLDAAVRDQYRTRWAKLRGENSPLRVLEHSGLISAPFSFFDDLVISCIPASWRRVVAIVGDVIGKLHDGPFRQAAVWALRARVLKLAQTGRVQIRGDLSEFWGGEVRRPDGRGR